MENLQKKKKIKWWQLILGVVLIVGIPVPVLYNMSPQSKEESHADTLYGVSKYQTYYRIIVDHARVYSYMHATDGTSYMLGLDRFYDNGCAVKGEIVHLDGQGDYLIIKWGDAVNQIGYLQLSDVEEDHTEAL